MDLFGLGVLIFCITTLMVFLLRKPAMLVGLVDIPSDRKRHFGDIPLVGGVAIFLTLMLAVPAGLLSWDPELAGFYLGGCVLLVTGLLDDRYDLSTRFKFGAQCLAAACLAWNAGGDLSNLGDLFGTGDIRLGDLALPFTVFAVVGLINAVNFFDGLDGLAGGMTLIALAAFTLVAVPTQQTLVLPLLIALLAAVAGFWIFNMRFHDEHRALVFMGNAGSMSLGFALSWFAARLTQGDEPAMPPVYALWFLALPLMDSVSLIWRRLRRNRNPFVASRDHLHHALLRAGLGHAGAVWSLLLAQTVLAGTGFACWRLGAPEPAMFAGFLMLFLIYNLAIQNGWKILASLKARDASRGPTRFP